MILVDSSSMVNMEVFSPGKSPQKIKLMVLMKKGGACVFDENLREVRICFKTRGGVSVILVNLRGGEFNLPLYLFIKKKFIYIYC